MWFRNGYGLPRPAADIAARRYFRAVFRLFISAG